MFGRWLFVRIRAAERALAEGRVDEAYVVATQPDVREHGRGRKLLDGLVAPLAARARLHAQAGRDEQALSDLERIRALGRATPEVEEFRQRVLERLRRRGERQADEQARCAQAAEQLEQGRLESARHVIAGVADSRRRDALHGQLDAKLERHARRLAQAEEALRRGDLLPAVRWWAETCAQHGRTRAGDDLAVRLAAELRRALDEWFRDGRLERFLAARDGVAALREFDPSLEEFEQLAELCARGSAQLAGRDYPALRETLLRMKAARGGVDWVESALAILALMAAGHNELLASALGLSASVGGDEAVATQPARAAAGRAPGAAAGVADRATAAHDDPLARLHARPLLLLIDGAGSSLLIAKERVALGQAGASRPVDVPLPADVQSHHADIVRVGEDYFLHALAPVSVNRREVHRALLRDGDRIHLAETVRLVFRRPSARSDTAVLSVGHRHRLPQDVSAVILFRDTCLIGPQPSCHIRIPEGRTQVVLFERDGGLFGREATAAGGKLGDPKPLEPGQTTDFGDVRLTLKRYEVEHGGPHG